MELSKERMYHILNGRNKSENSRGYNSDSFIFRTFFFGSKDVYDTSSIEICPDACFEITRKCNLKCLHCFADATYDNKDFINLDYMEEISCELAKLGVKRVSIAGGEPLLHGKVMSIIDVVKSYNCFLAPYVLLIFGIVYSNIFKESWSKR